MHILLLPSWYPKSPGDVAGVFFRDQALALYKSGHKVGVISPLFRSLRDIFPLWGKRDYPVFEDDEGVATYRKEVLAAFPRVPYANSYLFKRAARILMDIYVEQHGEPDIIHAHSALYGGVAAIELGMRWNIPVFLTEHSSGYARGVYMKWQLRLAAKVARSAQTCISVSPSLGDLLRRDLSDDDVLWKWIPNVVADRFKKKSHFASNYGKCRFINLALMTENKGQKDLLKAFRIAVERGLDGELWLVGDGPIRVQLERLACDLNIENLVYFKGLVPPSEVPGLFEASDVAMISSHYETFGVVAAEALMAGLPVISTRCGGPECIVTENDGLLVPINNPEALAEAMLLMANSLESYIPEDISNRAKRRFSSSAIADQLTLEYKKAVLNDHSVGP